MQRLLRANHNHHGETLELGRTAGRDDVGRMEGVQATDTDAARPELPQLPWAFIDCPTDDLVVLIGQQVFPGGPAMLLTMRGLYIAHMLNRLIEHNDQVILTPSTLTRFHSRAPPQITVIDYLRRIVKYTNLEVGVDGVHAWALTNAALHLRRNCPSSPFSPTSISPASLSPLLPSPRSPSTAFSLRVSRPGPKPFAMSFAPTATMPRSEVSRLASSMHSRGSLSR